MGDFKEIAVRVGADIEPLKKGFKTAGEQVKDFKGKAVGLAKQMTAVTAAVAGTAGAMVAMADKAAQSAREIKNLSMISGVSAERFQKLAAGARTVGIEQDKLADIFKDSKDKVGDFLSTGGGPLADFFENVAPKVGIMAEEFRYLSGPQILQKYTDGLEKANLSQAEMAFYMEAIASDATALIPLLGEGGKGFTEIGERAQETGAIISALDIEKLDKMKGSLDSITGSAKAGAVTFAAEFAPVIGALAEEFQRLRVETNNFGSASEAAFGFAVKTVGVFADGIRGIQVIVKGLEVAFHGFSVVVNTVLGNAAKGVEFFTNSVITGLNSMIAGFNSIPGVDDIGLLSYTNASGEILGWADTAKASMNSAMGELHDIMMQPLPSDKIDKFVASAVEAYETAAKESVAAIKNSGLVEASNKVNMTLEEGHKKYARSRTDNAKQAAGEEKEVQKLQLSDASSFFGNLSSLMGSENKKMFEIGKTAAKAQTVVDTYAAAQSAYKSLAGIPVVGPGLGIAAAGAAVVAGMARLNAISSTSFNGGGSISNAGATATPAAAQGQAGMGAGQSSSQSVFIEGGVNEGDLFRGSAINGLIDRINEAGADGKTINVMVSV